MKRLKRLTPAKLRRIKKLLVDRPHCRLVSGVSGLVTCDGYAIEFNDGNGRAGVIHPLAYLDLMEEVDNEPIDILKRPHINLNPLAGAIRLNTIKRR
jgi:hypothetical protein